MSFEPLINSFLLVTVAEIGDKTQLLSFILAARFKKPLPIIAGIFFATLLNHWLAAYLGQFASGFIPPHLQRWLMAMIFIFFGFWILKPDSDEGLKTHHTFGAFAATFISFFLAEMADKTQLATIALGAQYQDSLMVTMGSTLGMLAANVPAVLLGEKILKVLPLNMIRRIAAVLFFLFALLILLR